MDMSTLRSGRHAIQAPGDPGLGNAAAKPRQPVVSRRIVALRGGTGTQAAGVICKSGVRHGVTTLGCGHGHCSVFRFVDLRSEHGQTGTEYMLVISVIVVAVVAAAYTLVPTFQGGVAALAQDASRILDTGEVGGIGLDRGGGGGIGGGGGGGGFGPNAGAIGMSAGGPNIGNPGLGTPQPPGGTSGPVVVNPGAPAFARAGPGLSVGGGD